MSGEALVSRCVSCGQRYDPNPSGPAPITCDCGVGFETVVTFGEFPDGSRYAAGFEDVDDVVGGVEQQ